MTLILDMASGACDDSGKTTRGADAAFADSALLVPAATLVGLQEIQLDTDRLSSADKAAIRQHLLATRRDTD